MDDGEVRIDSCGVAISKLEHRRGWGRAPQISEDARMIRRSVGKTPTRLFDFIVSDDTADRRVVIHWQ